MLCTCRSTIASACSAAPAAVSDRRSIYSELRIGASGLRSSWASMARNSSLRRSASLSFVSTSMRSVMSIAMPPTNAGCPSGPGIGNLVTSE